MARFEWRSKLAQFWNRTVGRLVTRLQVRDVSREVLEKSLAQEWARAAANGDMSVQAWHQAMRDEIRKNVIEQYLAGRGGTGPMTKAEYGRIGAVIKEQYKWLDRFAAQMEAGEVSEGAAANRARMYINSAWEANERAYRIAAEVAGMKRVRWVWNPEAEHCDDCEDLNNSGWHPVNPWPFKNGRKDMYPGSGDTICLTSCRCFLEYT